MREVHEGVHDIIVCVNHALSLAVLRRGVGTRHPELDVVKEEESPRGVIKLSFITLLDSTNGAAKLCGHISEEVRKGGEGVRLVAQRESP
jgi:hypothetical protein